jgi:two-component system chemotaxis response regulator CheB
MADPLKVLVVDDSAIYRSLVQGCVRDLSALRCVGTARDGRGAITMAMDLRPDLILLDVEMPVMGGLEAIPHLRKIVPDAGIIMISSLTTEGANVTVEALQAGAFDFVTKPQVKAGEDGFAALREPLRAAIEAFREGGCSARAKPRRRPARARKDPVIDVIAIGVSTGGPSALAELIPGCPRSARAGLDRAAHARALHRVARALARGVRSCASSRPKTAGRCAPVKCSWRPAAST